MSTMEYYAPWLLVLAAVLVGMAPVTDSTQVHYIHWNSSNPIFRIDNTDHIFDVNAGNFPGEYDQANIICPVYKTGTSTEEAEKFIIYNVSKEEYEMCRIMEPNPKVIAICNKPSEVMYFTITFRSFTPTPGAIEFKEGQDYYFISTSTPDDLESRQGGKCASHNMKVMFKVGSHTNNKKRPAATTEPAESNSNSMRKHNKATPRPRRKNTPSSGSVSLLDNNRLDERPTRGRSGRRRRPKSERGNGRDLIKQEASRMHDSSSAASAPAPSGMEAAVNLLGSASGAGSVSPTVALVFSVLLLLNH